MTVVAAVALFGAAFGFTSQSPASAASQIYAEIIVGADGSAVGTVRDTVFPNTSVIVALAAVGTGTCQETGPVIAIHDAATGSGNPASVRTDGSCGLYNAEATYSLTWTTLLGTSGDFVVQCAWAARIQVCTPNKTV